MYGLRASTTSSLCLVTSLALACSGDDDPSPTTANASAASLTQTPSETSGDGDGDGDPSTSTTTTAGDGDGDGPLLDFGMGTAGDGPDPEECIQDVDIVFVMDVSTTMGPFFDKLEAEIGAVHDALQNFDLPNDPHYGLVVFVDDFTLVNTGVPYTDINELAADFAYWNNYTSTNQQTKGGGLNSTWTENSLDALYAGAGGFQWRPLDSTLRIIIHTTDDTFWNGPTVGNGVNILHNYPETVDILQDKQIRMFTFADFIGGQCECDDVSKGFFSDFQGQPPIPEQTGGGAYPIGEVLAGVISLSDSITTAVEETYCEEYPPVD